jgi:adenosine kinase
MKKKIIVSGSIAYDQVMHYFGNFKNTFHELDVSMLNFSFLAMNREIYFGGCAGNICYNLGLLGLDPLICGAVGKDFSKYRAWLEKHNVHCDYLEIDSKHLTASAFMLVDDEEHQLGFFSPEAMCSLPSPDLLKEIHQKEKLDLMHIGPDFPARINAHVKSCQELNIKYIYDPGRDVLRLDAEMLRAGIDGACALIGNRFEIEQILKKLDIDLMKLAKMTPILICTKGYDGSDVYINGKLHHVEAIPADEVVDPTGCGDAYRAGVIKAIAEDDDILHGCRLGAAIASLSIASKGPQNHGFTMNDLTRQILKSGE